MRRFNGAEIGPTCVMSRIMNQWGGSSYSPFDGVTPGAEGALAAFDALWVKAFKSGISLRIPARASVSCSAAKATAAGGARSRSSAADWYVRLIAEAGDLRDGKNVFGHLGGSADGYDRHDLRELRPSAAPYLTVVFPHPEWGDQAGDYATDYHARKHGADRWRFAVRASEGVERVRLCWQGPGPKLRAMRLRDEETGHTVSMRPGSCYPFRVTGRAREFTVVAQLVY